MGDQKMKNNKPPEVSNQINSFEEIFDNEENFIKYDPSKLQNSMITIGKFLRD